MSKAVIGIVYLIHFETKIADHAGHYLGFVEEDLINRIGEHRTGNGSKLMAEVSRLGIPWRLVATWQGDRYFERKLKNKHGSRLCPICNPNGKSKYDNQRINLEDHVSGGVT